MKMDLITLLHYLRMFDDHEVAQRVLEASEYIAKRKKYVKEDQKRLQTWRTTYYIVAARYHAGLCTAEEVGDILLSLSEQSDENDYTPAGLNTKIAISAYALCYIRLAGPERAALFEERIRKVVLRNLEYINKMSASDYPRIFSNAMQLIVSSQVQYDGRIVDGLMDYILVGHRPTYVHSLMVAEITRLIVDRMIETSSDGLSGVLGFNDKNAIKEHAKEISDSAYRCGIYHDVGKCLVLGQVEIYNRKLLNEEFRYIQDHTRLEKCIIDEMSKDDELETAALYHHRFYDGNGGYQNDLPPCDTRFKPIVDIISVADSLDAATDYIGRSYMNAKKVEDVVLEIKAGSGKRYSPYIAELLGDADFIKKIRELLIYERRKIYIEVYKHKKIFG